MAIDINIPIEDAVTDGSLNPVTSNAVFDALALKANEADLALVATSGDYNDLDNLPTIPSIAGLVPDTRNLTINGTTYDLSADRSWTIAATASTLQHEVKAGEVMTKGQAVYVSSADGTNMIVSLASNATESTSSKTMGLIIQNLANNGKGYVITEGLLTGLNTSSATAGDPVWLGTGGNLIYGLTNKPAAPAHLVFIGIVTRSNSSNGEIFVRVQNGFELQELHNVAISSVADNNILQYDFATSLWKNESFSTAGIQPTLVSATNIKTINGTTLLGSGDLVVGGSSGIFGITNASGVYTYYATLTLAMAAATSGQTIEMFANITETGAIEITLKDGVNINGNGYTYTLNNSGSSNAFKVTNSTSINCSIINLNVIRTGSTGAQSANCCLYSGASTSGNIYLTGSKFTNSGSGSGIAIGSASTISIYDGTAIANTTFGSIYIESSAGAKVYNSTGISTSQAGINCYIGGDLFNCIGISSSGIGIDGAGATTAGNQFNCTGIAITGAGLTTGLMSVNCIGRSTSGSGISSNSPSKVYGCVGISVSGRGISNVSSVIYNSQGISSSGIGFLLQTSTAILYNCLAKSDSTYSIWGWNGSKVYNSIIECNWNNVGGNGIQGISGFITNTIVNCVFKLSNATAPYLNNGGTAQAISMRGNIYQGGGAFNINLTQAIVAVQDTQGNIFL